MKLLTFSSEAEAAGKQPSLYNRYIPSHSCESLVLCSAVCVPCECTKHTSHACPAGEGSAWDRFYSPCRVLTAIHIQWAPWLVYDAFEVLSAQWLWAPELQTAWGWVLALPLTVGPWVGYWISVPQLSRVWNEDNHSFYFMGVWGLNG